MAAGTISSNLYTAGQQARSPLPGVEFPVYGSIVIPANTSFATTDILKMFQMPGPNSHIRDGWIDFPAMDGGSGLTFKLVDTLATPNTFFTGNTVAQAGGFLSLISVMTVTQHGLIGSGVNYTVATDIELVPSHASTNTTGASALTIYFAFTLLND